MELQEIHLPNNHQDFINRFVAVCQSDERVVAAFLGGSYAKNTADAFSDIDLYLITSDEAYEDFLSGRDAFTRLMGEPLFLEDFGNPHILFYIFPNNTEGELWIGRASHFHHMHAGPYRVLFDKKGILAKEVFPQHQADQTKQEKILHQQVTWFWHELSHFIKAMGRGQLWFAYGQIEVMRQICVNLVRLKYNFSDTNVGEEPYFKVEQALPVEQLTPLRTTFCALEYEVMLQAAYIIAHFYQEMAPNLAKAHGVTYQVELERMMISQLEALGEVSEGQLNSIEQVNEPIHVGGKQRVINQGDIFWARSDNPREAELGNYPHPFVVIQDNVFNHSRINSVVVCALTSNLKQANAPGNVLLDAGEANLPKHSVIVVSKISAVNKTKLGEYIGTLNEQRINQIMAGIRFLQLSFFT